MPIELSDRLRGAASACGSATVVNAISTGKGAAFAVDLRVIAEVDLREDKNDISGRIEGVSEDSSLIEKCVEKVLRFYGVGDQYGAEVRTTTELPVAVGLSSSSAAANATVLATSLALDEDIEAEEAINLGIEAALEEDVTITGAYDDASASYYGGGVVTDNRERALLERFSLDPDLNVLVFLPSGKLYTSDFDVDRAKMISDIVEIAHDEALDGNIFGAQTLNGLLYSSILDFDTRPAVEALDSGALCAGLTGTGPAVVAISEANIAEKIKDAWGDKASEIIFTKPSKEGAREEHAR